jgi:TatD DNase family protein
MMEELSSHPKVLAIGEIGLDYFYDHSPRELQQQVFVSQMELARRVKKPIILHIRPSTDSENAWEDCFRLLEEHWVSQGLGTVFHCFTGEVKHVERALAMGCMISFAGNISFPKAQNIRDAAKVVPFDRFFIETDCPYLAPVPHRGKRNEPAFVAETARHFGASLPGIFTDSFASVRNLASVRGPFLGFDWFPFPCFSLTLKGDGFR